MSYYVYVMKSLKDQTYYKGFTENYLQRLTDHNAGLSQYTSRKIPWQLIYVEEHQTKQLALSVQHQFCPGIIKCRHLQPETFFERRLCFHKIGLWLNSKQRQLESKVPCSFHQQIGGICRAAGAEEGQVILRVE